MSQPSNAQDKNKNASQTSRQQEPRASQGQEISASANRSGSQREPNAGPSGQPRSASGSRDLQDSFEVGSDADSRGGERAERGDSRGGDRNELRQAMSELAQSVECLCGDSSNKDTAGAKRHLDQAKRLLDSPIGDNGSRSAPGRSGSSAQQSSTSGRSSGEDERTMR